MGLNIRTWDRDQAQAVTSRLDVSQNREQAGRMEPITLEEFGTQMAELAKHRDSGAVEVVTFKDGADRLRRPKLFRRPCIQSRIYYEARGKCYRLPFKNLEGRATSINTGV